MNLIGVLVLCATLCALSGVQGGWLEELSGSRGIDLGGGVSLHLDPLKRENASLLEGHALRLDYSGMGFRVAKVPHREVLQVGLYTGEGAEGRKKESGEMLIPMVLGFKITGVAALLMVGVTLLVIKALAVGKLGFFVALGMILAKYLHQGEPIPHVEVEHAPLHYPYLSEHPSATGYSPSASANYYSYANYGATGVEGAQSGGQFTVVEAPTGNSTAVIPAGKRHDFLRRKAQPLPFLTVRKYTIQH